MEFRHLGESGLVVSVVGLGTNNFGMKLDDGESREVVHAALDAGITLFDTADSYGASERRLGASLAGHRDDVIIATKFGGDVRNRGGDNGEDWGARGSRRYIRRAVESSLRALGTDWIDLYQLHRPDPVTPIEETLSALSDLVREGKVRYLGSSNFAGWQVADAQWIARDRGHERFISAQNDYSLLNRGVEDDLVPALEHYGIGLLPFFPLANGLLTGKYRRGEPAPAGSRLAAPGREATFAAARFRRGRGSRGVRCRPVHFTARRRDRWAGRATGRVERDRRRYVARAGRRERRRGRMAAEPGRSRRTRRADGLTGGRVPTGSGAITADGCPVDLYTLLPEMGEAQIVHSAVSDEASVLDLGCGTGRIAHALIDLGHEVVAVDQSGEMLAHVTGAGTVCASIAGLDLGRRFGAVLLASHLLNSPDAVDRRALLATAARHLADGGRLIAEWHPPAWFDTVSDAAGGRGGKLGPVEIQLVDVHLDGDLLSATVRYWTDTEVWTQPFTARRLTDAGVREELSGAGLRFDGWLTEDHAWFAAAPND